MPYNIMIISASRRTDIPSFYSEWLYNRIREGFLLNRNPYYPEKITKIQITPDVVDCIVFWTKDPNNMLSGLPNGLNGIPCYFQFTLTPYGKDIEPNMRDKRDILQTFQTLSMLLTKMYPKCNPRDFIVWRYDPIILTPKYNKTFHKRSFAQMIKHIAPYINKCIISFVDIYENLKARMNAIGAVPIKDSNMIELADSFSKIASQYGITVESCCEKIDLAPYGIKHGHCIDADQISRITGCTINLGKDKGQREACGCVESIDIGAYTNTDIQCHGCIYCYARSNRNKEKHYPSSPLLFGLLTKQDEVSEKIVKSSKINQMTF